MAVVDTVSMEDVRKLTRGRRRRHGRVLRGRWKLFLRGLLAMFALLSANSVYLACVSVAQWFTGELVHNYFYHLMYLAHVLAGLTIVVPVGLFATAHIRAGWKRRNLPAKTAGAALLTCVSLLLLSGLLLLRVDAFGVRLWISGDKVRQTLYGIHVLAPLAAAWLFLLHRLAGRPIRWRFGGRWALISLLLLGVMGLLHAQDPRRWLLRYPATGAGYFEPSSAHSASGAFIPRQALDNDEYCRQCHAAVHADWSSSGHRLSSFNNPVYAAGWKYARQTLHARDGHTRGIRMCAGCHDPVPLFSGELEQPRFLDPSFEPDASLRQRAAGITCSVCHGIVRIDSPGGNAAYTIDEPATYPFSGSRIPLFQWLNRQLIQNKPDLHKRSYLRPFHKTAEFCGVCHKMQLEPELTGKNWVRDLGTYDEFILSGFSGAGAPSFYFPDRAPRNCNACHMPEAPAQSEAGLGTGDVARRIAHSHRFAAFAAGAEPRTGSTGLPESRDRRAPDGALRVDLFGLRLGPALQAQLLAPLRPVAPVLDPGKTYVLEVVIRSTTIGHDFPGELAQAWLEVTLRAGERLIAQSGVLGPSSRSVDKDAYILQRGRRNRSGERGYHGEVVDIVGDGSLNVLSPAASDVVHYRFTSPGGWTGTLTAEVKLQYRTLDPEYLQRTMALGAADAESPIRTIATDRFHFIVGAAASQSANPPPSTPPWMRWNDYGIGTLRDGDEIELSLAEGAFGEVAKLGVADGWLNLARLYRLQGRLDEARNALELARQSTPPPNAWSIGFVEGRILRDSNNSADAASCLDAILRMDNPVMRTRGLDFSNDLDLLQELAGAYLQQAQRKLADEGGVIDSQILRQAEQRYLKILERQPENAAAHAGIAAVLEGLGQSAAAAGHREKSARFSRGETGVNGAMQAGGPAKVPAVIYELKAVAQPE